MLNRIVERSGNYMLSFPADLRLPPHLAAPGMNSIAIAHSVKSVVSDIDVKYILVWSRSGRLSYFLSQLRVPKPVLAFSDLRDRLRRGSLLYGLQPVFMEKPASSRDFLRKADEMLLANAWAEKGDPVVVVFDEPFSVNGISNLLSVHRIGEYSGTQPH
jgi:pyruvate kinase